ncbi:MAG TPA: hypothetical protein VJ901_23030 [Thermoanaerobaculia bacterium]|nr:hypothetical protein [Thermoanaerobaculia bacterium]
MTKRLLALLTVLLAACSSSTPKVEHQVLEGGPGQAIEVSIVGFTQPVLLSQSSAEMPQNIHMQFEVSNNSNDTVTVTRIQVDQSGSAPIQIEPAQGGFNESIEPGHEHTFDVSAVGKQVSLPHLGQNNDVIIRVVVSLMTGDSYVYNFSIPVSALQ